MLFSLDTATTKKRTDQFHTEIDYIWLLLTDEMKKSHNSNKEMVSLALNETTTQNLYRSRIARFASFRCVQREE